MIYTTTGSDPGTVTLSLYDMTGATYNDVSGGSLIGPANMFTITPGSSMMPQIQEVNTSTLTPAGPYPTVSNRSVAVRMTATTPDCCILLSVSIGFSTP